MSDAFAALYKGRIDLIQVLAPKCEQENRRIYHECKVLKTNLTRITVKHHSAEPRNVKQ